MIIPEDTFISKGKMLFWGREVINSVRILRILLHLTMTSMPIIKFFPTQLIPKNCKYVLNSACLVHVEFKDQIIFDFEKVFRNYCLWI